MILNITKGKEEVWRCKGANLISKMYASDTIIQRSHVLNNFNLHVTPGETIALVGESGSGKSTIPILRYGF